MNFKRFFAALLSTFLLLTYSWGSPVSANGERGLSFMSNGKRFVEDSIQQFSIEVLYTPLNRLSSGFENVKVQMQNDTTNLNNYNVAGYSFVPIKVATQGNEDTMFFYTKGFYAILTLWKNSQVNGVPQPQEVAFFMNDKIFTIENGLSFLETNVASQIKGVLNLSSGSADIQNIQTSKYTGSDPIMHNTREFELVFLDMGTFKDLATNTRFYRTGTRPNGTQGIVIERSFNSINPLTSVNTFDFQSFRSLIFKPYPIPNLRSDYDAESAFAFSHGYNCPPYWRPDDEIGAEEETNLTPEEYRAGSARITPNINSTVLANVKRVSQAALTSVTSKSSPLPLSFWEKPWFKMIFYVLSALGLIFIITLAKKR
ncbi:MAG TPA: hypothetical protein ENJ53_04285 [Phaeodactylibacter sp.]|nr:hypothetical protein [Phaeodactylibacter sp.]